MWFYDGDVFVDSDLLMDLCDYVGVLEFDYLVWIDVVLVGFFVECVSGEIVVVVCEVILNVVWYVGGEIFVYIEGSVVGVDVFICDCGVGFEFDDVLSDCFGVWELIIGCMWCVGGIGFVCSDEYGIEVYLSIMVGMLYDRFVLWLISVWEECCG